MTTDTLPAARRKQRQPDLEPVPDTPAGAPAASAWRLAWLQLVDRTAGDRGSADLLASGRFPDPTTLELRFTSDTPLAGTVRAAVDEVHQQALAGLAAVRQDFAGTQTMAKVRRLRVDLARAQQEVQAAARRAQEALAKAQQALGDSQDPAPHETTYRANKQDEEIIGNRAAALTKLLEQAEKQAKGELRAALEERLGQLVAGARTEWDRLVGELAAATLERLAALETARCLLMEFDRGNPHTLRAMRTGAVRDLLQVELPE